MKICPVILSGGSGTRLWPLSRSGFPKQFLSLLGNTTLFQDSVKRLAGYKNDKYTLQDITVVCNEEHRFLTVEQLREIGVSGALILEPMGKNTAPALTLAALSVVERNGDGIMLVTPSDHTIRDREKFHEAIDLAIKAIDTIDEVGTVLLGIEPTCPETGYGYIKRSKHQLNTDGAWRVDSFVEKPSLKVAQEFLESCDYLWNAGIFITKASTWLRAVNTLRPDIYMPVQDAWNLKNTEGVFIRPDPICFEKSAAESVDCAVIERAGEMNEKNIVIPFDASWGDMGAWDSVAAELDSDKFGNNIIGDAIVESCSNSLIFSNSRLVAALGIDNSVIVETDDVVLVADKSRVQDLKNVVKLLQKNKRSEVELHRKVHRPWGWYDTVVTGEKFKVKRIKLNPGASISLQSHQHRAEHWVVVEGVAEVTCEDKLFILNKDESTYIPMGAVHQLRNKDNVALEIIEIQSGNYLAEDDIKRYKDEYGRK